MADTNDDYRTMFDRPHIAACDLDGRDVTITIEAVNAGELVGKDGKKAKKPIIKIKGKDKTFACNVTNARVIAGMYGNRTREWVGKQITIYPTTTSFGRDTVECIRIRNAVPTARRNAQPPPASAPASPDTREREPGDDDGPLGGAS